MSDDRGTGRTTRMLVDLENYQDRTGRPAIVIVHSNIMRTYLLNLCRRLEIEITPSRVHVLTEELTRALRYRRCFESVFVDHAVYENSPDHMIDMLNRELELLRRHG